MNPYERKVLPQMSGPVPETYRFGRFCINVAKHALYLDQDEVPLKPKTFQVLLYLTRNPGRLVSKEELLKAVWPESFVEESNLAQQISRLRKALEVDPAAASYVHTTPGLGYQFTAEVTRETPPEVLEIVAPTPLAVGIWRERTSVIVEELEPLAAPARRPVRLWLALSAFVLVLLGVAGVFLWKRLHPPDHHEIVLADFDNQTGDPTFNTVLKMALSIDLRQSPELALLGSGDAADTLKRMLRPGEPIRGPVAVEVCRRNNDEAVLSGTIARLEKSYLITLEATDCKTGREFAAEKGHAAGKDDVVEVLGQLDSRMRRHLGESLQSIQNFDVPLAKSTTSSLEALIAFSQGIRQDFLSSIPYFERAIELDPKFAMAWEDLGVANNEIGNLAVSRAAYIHAYQLREGTTAHEKFWLTTRYNETVMNDLEGEAKTFRLFTRSYPREDPAWASLSDTLRQMGRYPEALEAAQRAHVLGPRNVFTALELAKAYQASGQFELARQVCREGLALHSDDPAMHQILLVNDFALHDMPEYDREIALSRGQDLEFQILTLHARALAASGRLKEARHVFDDARENARRHAVRDFPHIDDAEQSLSEALLGYPAIARELAATVPDDMRDNSVEAVLASALAGDVPRVEKMIEQLQAEATDTSDIIRQYWVPILRAVLAVHAGENEQAMSLLKSALNFAPREYWVWNFLGEAMLMTNHPEDAAIQYQQIIQHPGIDPLSPMLPMAHLGLARVYATERHVPESAAEYQKFFQLWNSADPDLPVLKQARAEYGRIHIN